MTFSLNAQMVYAQSLKSSAVFAKRLKWLPDDQAPRSRYCLSHTLQQLLVI